MDKFNKKVNCRKNQPTKIKPISWKKKLANSFHLIFQTTFNCKKLIETMKNESKKKERERMCYKCKNKIEVSVRMDDC